ncbi:MAG: ABC transporter ATP-binding protein [Lachnoclostridium sp.]|nr:ABC transporter ATP-binding protein [Lachnoclostridium sp.]
MTDKQRLFEDIKIGDDMLTMENITKIYENGFVANSNVNFNVRKGEIHGLVGENGAGKTTLMKVLFGQETPEGGRILIAGQEQKISSPLDALDYGIGMVHQHFMLVDELSVADNMVLGGEPVKGILYDRAEARRLALETSKKYDLEVDPDAIVGKLSVGHKQRVEILKILLKGAKLLLLDEPTAVLTPQEIKELFVQLKHLRDQGFSIVFISHKLNEVREICDRITVLRMGKSVGTVDIKDVTEADISRMMVGRDVMLDIEKESAKPEEIVLKVRDLSYGVKQERKIFSNISFDVRAGEILGVAGVEGNGQAELADVIAGLLPVQTGDVCVNGKSIRNVKSIREIREMGVSLVHQDRMIYGASKTQSIQENIVADRYYKKEYSKNGLLNWKKVKEESLNHIKEFLVKCEGPDAAIKTLSGGNIQKVVAAREFTSNPKFLLSCHPTRGIDVGAAEMIRKKIVELRDKERTAVLLFSADLTELLSVSDSIFVMYEGEIVAYFPDAKKVDEQILGEYMLGLKRQSAEEIGGVIFE